MIRRQADLLRETLSEMADRGATRPDFGSRLADHAVKGARRRRAARMAGAGVITAAAAAAVTVPIALRGPGPARVVQTPLRPEITGPHQAVLPPSTPAQTALVKACMVGNPTFSNSTDRQTGPGTQVADFRVLVTSDRLTGGGRMVLLGSTAATRTCYLDSHGVPSAIDRIPHQTAYAWPQPFPTFHGPFSVDGRGGGVLGAKGVTPNPANWVQGIAGRVAPEVSRMTFTSPKGEVRAATVANGYFIWAIYGKGRGLPDDRPIISTVKFYGPDGRLLATTHYGEAGESMFTGVGSSAPGP